MSKLTIVSYLPAQHRADCPAQDNWGCNCGAQQEPLVRLSEAQAAVLAATPPQQATPAEPAERFWRVKIRYTDEKDQRQEISVVASEPRAESIVESGEVASQRALAFAHSLNPFGSRSSEYEVVSASTTKLPLQLATPAASPIVAAQPDERAEFEAWYCADAQKEGFDVTSIEHLREGDHYGTQRIALNSKWGGWQARAALATRGACEHDWIDARNVVIQSGEACLKCGMVRAGNTLRDVAP